MYLKYLTNTKNYLLNLVNWILLTETSEVALRFRLPQFGLWNVWKHIVPLVDWLLEVKYVDLEVFRKP